MSAGEAAPERAELTRSLVLRLRAGDAECGELLERLHREPLRRFAARYLRDADEVEDVVQDAFTRALASEVLPDDFRAWLYRVTRNLCLNRLRDRGARPVCEGLASDAEPLLEQSGHATRLGRAEERAALARELARLSEAQREALVLRYVEGLSREEIAGVLGLTVPVVKSRIYEGLKSLRRQSDPAR